MSTASGSLQAYGDAMTGAMTTDFLPVLKRTASYGSEVPIETYVGRAAADVQGSYSNALGQMERNLSRMGVNPNSGRFYELQRDWSQALAAAESGAKSRARTQGQTENLDRMLKVSTLGLQAGQAGASALSQSGSLSLQEQQLSLQAQQQAWQQDNLAKQQDYMREYDEAALRAYQGARDGKSPAAIPTSTNPAVGAVAAVELAKYVAPSYTQGNGNVNFWSSNGSVANDWKGSNPAPDRM